MDLFYLFRTKQSRFANTIVYFQVVSLNTICSVFYTITCANIQFSNQIQHCPNRNQIKHSNSTHCSTHGKLRPPIFDNRDIQMYVQYNLIQHTSFKFTSIFKVYSIIANMRYKAFKRSNRSNENFQEIKIQFLEFKDKTISIEYTRPALIVFDKLCVSMRCLSPHPQLRLVQRK